jgi:hypothetical protein
MTIEKHLRFISNLQYIDFFFNLTDKRVFLHFLFHLELDDVKVSIEYRAVNYNTYCETSHKMKWDCGKKRFKSLKCKKVLDNLMLEYCTKYFNFGLARNVQFKWTCLAMLVFVAKILWAIILFSMNCNVRIDTILLEKCSKKRIFLLDLKILKSHTFRENYKNLFLYRGFC